jgi:hypothetical protein
MNLLGALAACPPASRDGGAPPTKNPHVHICNTYCIYVKYILQFRSMADWVVFSYSLPAQAGSTPRVTLWRRLRRYGAISPTGSVYLLPANPDCVEAFQWLAQEIRQAQGEALVMHVSQFAGLTDAQMIELFNEARQAEYEEIQTQAAVLAQQLDDEAVESTAVRASLEKLQKQHADIASVDYFHCAKGAVVAAQLRSLAQRLLPGEWVTPVVEPAVLTDYQGQKWVTRPRPHVDRLACAWLIRRFIDPQAPIRYSEQPEANEVAFDMSDGRFGHVGNLCTFEVMLRAFNLDEAGLLLLAEIVHEIDLRDGRYPRPEVTGVDAILRGWLLKNLSDLELESHGLALFDGLFAGLSKVIE